MENNKTITVEILECGTKCKTLNPLGKLKDYSMYCCHCDCGFEDIPVPCETYKHWKQAESARQVYEIDHTCDENVCFEIRDSWKPSCKVKPGTQHSAVIIDEQRKIVKIV